MIALIDTTATKLCSDPLCHQAGLPLPVSEFYRTLTYCKTCYKQRRNRKYAPEHKPALWRHPCSESCPSWIACKAGRLWAGGKTLPCEVLLDWEQDREFEPSEILRAVPLEVGIGL